MPLLFLLLSLLAWEVTVLVAHDFFNPGSHWMLAFFNQMVFFSNWKTRWCFFKPGGSFSKPKEQLQGGWKLFEAVKNDDIGLLHLDALCCLEMVVLCYACV